MAESTHLGLGIILGLMLGPDLGLFKPAVAASIGSPATSGAGIIILSMVLEGVGIPAAGIALLLGVDRILDMCRTAVNVLGNVILCSVAEKWLAVDDESDLDVDRDLTIAEA